MYQRILVPVDGSPTSNAGLDEALMLAQAGGAQMLLMHVVDEMPFIMGAEGYGAVSGDVFDLLKEAGEKILADAKAHVEKSGMAAETRLFDSFGGRLCEQVAPPVPDWGADLIVLGTHGRRGARRMLLGSDAEQVLRTATVPVLLVRSAKTAPAP